jgi:RNA polymerase sigma-70 factor (ECF subfamily)
MRSDAELAGDAVELVVRDRYGKLVAYLASRTRDVAGAEDALSEALATALTDWPKKGIPDSPEAWLLTVARRRLVDTARQRETRGGAVAHLQLLTEELLDDATREAGLPDERLNLMFACAHPAIDARMRAPLILQAVLGFDAASIAAAFLLSPATMGQRLVRAKAKIKEAGIPFSIPERGEMQARVEAVLEAIYAAFTEGWTNPAGDDFHRRELAEEAIWLCRLVVDFLPGEAEALGLLSLMLHLEARRGARRDADGDFVPLGDQDISRWNLVLIDEAEGWLAQASRIGCVGRYQLEAAVQSAHAIRRRDGRADWAALETLYARLLALTCSPVVAINRAVVIAELRGAEAGLAALDELRDEARLLDYQPYWAARAELLARACNVEAADAAYERAITLEADPTVKRFLEGRRERLRGRAR